MAKSLITQTLGGPSHGVQGLIEISDKIARLSEAGDAFETKRRKLEHQFKVTNSELREEYLTCWRSTNRRASWHDAPQKITKPRQLTGAVSRMRAMSPESRTL